MNSVTTYAITGNGTGLTLNVTFGTTSGVFGGVVASATIASGGSGYSGASGNSTLVILSSP